MSKASAESVYLMLMHEQCANGECCKTAEEAENGLASASNQTVKIKALRNCITIHAKGLG